jgi:hypothetical protein
LQAGIILVDLYHRFFALKPDNLADDSFFTDFNHVKQAGSAQPCRADYGAGNPPYLAL